MSDPALTIENGPAVPLPRLAAFVRQITHDVRNGLNAIDLQAALIGEIAGDGEVAEEARKLRKIVNNITEDMQALSRHFAEMKPVLMAFPVQEMLQGLKEAVEEEFETRAKRIVWEVKTGEVEIEMDYNLLTGALMELTRNAIFFRDGDQPIHFTAWDDKSGVVFEVKQNRPQPASDPQNWGREPLVSTRRGGYGLGLFYVRRILDTLGGKLETAYDSAAGELTVRLILPLNGAERPGPEQ